MGDGDTLQTFMGHCCAPASGNSCGIHGAVFFPVHLRITEFLRRWEGQFDVVATVLYNEMLGSVPNFQQWRGSGNDDAAPLCAEHISCFITWSAIMSGTIRFPPWR